jgi:hypothetical protein
MQSGSDAQNIFFRIDRLFFFYVLNITQLVENNFLRADSIQLILLHRARFQ